MSLLDGITPEQAVTAIEGIARDVSIFAPPPASTIASLIAGSAMVLEKILRAQASGTPIAELEQAVEAAMLAASDAQMKSQLGP